MDNSPESGDTLRRRLDGELELVRQAILLVAAGGAPRVLVAGLRLGPQLLEPAERLAAASGVCLVPEWTTDETGLDIRVEATAP